jgi:hypothetical protein
VLADELGIDPGPALRTLEVEVLAQSPALQPPPMPAPRAREPAAPAAAPAADLVEREPEMRAVEDALAKVQHGQGGTLLVQGPAGIGKSRLMAEAAAAGGGTRAAGAASPRQRTGDGVRVRRRTAAVRAAAAEPDARARLLAGPAAPAGGRLRPRRGPAPATRASRRCTRCTG